MFDLIQTAPTTVHTTPPCHPTEGWRGAPTGLTAVGVFDSDGGGERRNQQLTGVVYENGSSPSTSWEGAVASYNEMCKVLYLAVRRMKRLEEILGPSGVITDWVSDAGRYAEDRTHYTSRLVTYSGTSYGPMFTADFSAVVGTSDDPRGFKPSDEGSPYFPCLTPGMRARAWCSTDATVPVVIAHILNVTYLDSDSMRVRLDRNVGVGSDTLRVAHDLLPMSWQAWPLYQNIDPPVCQNCIPTAAGGYIASILGTFNRYRYSPALAIQTDGTDYSFCAQVNALDAMTDPRGHAAITAYTVHCANTACPLYTRAHQSRPTAKWFGAMAMGRGLVEMTDSSDPPQNYMSRGRWDAPGGGDFSGSVGINGFLRYMGLCLDNERAWSTEDGGDPPGHTVAFPFVGTSFWPAEWAEGSKTPFFTTWRDMAVAAHNDNVGLLAEMAAHPAYPKRSPDGGEGTDELADSDLTTPIEKAIGIRRSLASGNWHTDTPNGPGEDGVQLVRPRKIKSPTFIANPDHRVTVTDSYGSVTAKADGSIDFAVGCFQRAPGDNRVNVKPVSATIAHATITDGFLEVSFALGECQAQHQDGGSNVMLTAPSGGNVVSSPMWRIPNNPGWTPDGKSLGDGQRGLGRGDVLVLSVGSPAVARHLLCVDAKAFAGSLQSGSELPVGTEYIDEFLRTDMPRADWAKFLLIGEDGDAVTALLTASGTALNGIAGTVQQSAILPDPTYYPPTVYWCPDGGEIMPLTDTDHLIDEDGNTIVDEEGNTLTYEGGGSGSSVTVDPGRGVMHIPSGSGLTGSGHLFFEGWVFSRNQSRNSELAYNLLQQITNVAGLPYYAISVPLSPTQVVMQRKWTSDGGVTSFLTDPIDSAFDQNDRRWQDATTGTADPAPPVTIITGGRIPVPGASSHPLAPVAELLGEVWLVSVVSTVAVGWLVSMDTSDLLYVPYSAGPPARYPYWVDDTYMLTIELSGAQLLLFTPGSVSILPSEIAQWLIVIRIKNGQIHRKTGLTTFKPQTFGLGPEDDATPEEIWSTETARDITAVLLEFVQLSPGTYNDAACYTGIMTLGAAASVGSGGPVTVGADTYTDVLIDATYQVQTMLNDFTRNPGSVVGLRLKIPAASAPLQSFVASGRNYVWTYDYSWLTFDAMECVGQFVKIVAVELDNGSDFHFDGTGAQVPGPCFTGGGA